MSIRITDHQMDSDTTTATARRTADGWQASWLPDRVLSRDQATTAMVIAETLATPLPLHDRRWRFVDQWAAELGITGAHAVANVVVAEDPITTG